MIGYAILTLFRPTAHFGNALATSSVVPPSRRLGVARNHQRGLLTSWQLASNRAENTLAYLATYSVVPPSWSLGVARNPVRVFSQGCTISLIAPSSGKAIPICHADRSLASAVSLRPVTACQTRSVCNRFQPTPGSCSASYTSASRPPSVPDLCSNEQKCPCYC